MANFKEKLQSGVPLDDLLPNYNKHVQNTHEMNKSEIKGWEKVIYKHEPKHDPLNPYFLNKSYGDKYEMYNHESMVSARYWDTKENEEYYSLSKYQRMKLYLKDLIKVNINYDFVILNIIVLLILAYYAKKKSEQMI